MCLCEYGETQSFFFLSEAIIWQTVFQKISSFIILVNRWFLAGVNSIDIFTAQNHLDPVFRFFLRSNTSDFYTAFVGRSQYRIFQTHHFHVHTHRHVYVCMRFSSNETKCIETTQWHSKKTHTHNTRLNHFRQRWYNISFSSIPPRVCVSWLFVV